MMINSHCKKGLKIIEYWNLKTTEFVKPCLCWTDFYRWFATRINPWNKPHCLFWSLFHWLCHCLAVFHLKHCFRSKVKDIFYHKNSLRMKYLWWITFWAFFGWVSWDLMTTHSNQLGNDWYNTTKPHQTSQNPKEHTNSIHVENGLDFFWPCCLRKFKFVFYDIDVQL